MASKSGARLGEGRHRRCSRARRPRPDPGGYAGPGRVTLLPGINPTGIPSRPIRQFLISSEMAFLLQARPPARAGPLTDPAATAGPSGPTVSPG